MPPNNKKILVADDDDLNRKLLKEFLSFYSYDVECVDNGKDAIALIKTGHYDVLITDYVMPGINGVELTKRVRSLNLSLPIIGISASGDEQEFMAAGANLFMEKPLTLSMLKNALERNIFT